MQTDQATLKDRHHKILQTIQSHVNPAKGSPAELIAVSKTQPESQVRAVFALGQRLFGENYAQELQDKAEALKDLPIHWIYIGHLQSNKLKKIVTYASEIQTVASFEHARHIARHAREAEKTPFPIFLEVNAEGETSKSGIPAEDILPLAKRIETELPELKLRGLMVIPPDSYSDEACKDVPELYRKLRTLANQVGEGKLSLGMSNDLRIALEAGSDFVRVGTAIFGRRS